MPGSCSSGFRSRPSAAAGKQPLERVRGEQDEEQEAARSRGPCTPSTRASMRSGRWRLNDADGERPARRASAPTAAASPRAPPQVAAKRYCTGSVELELARHVRHREVVGDERPARGRRRRRRRTATARAARAAPRPSRPALPGGAPASGERGLREREREREDQREVAELGDHRSCLSGPAKCGLVHRMPRALQRLGGLRRHVVLVVLGEHLARVERAVGAELCPARPRPCPRGTGPGRMPV